MASATRSDLGDWPGVWVEIEGRLRGEIEGGRRGPEQRGHGGDGLVGERPGLASVAVDAAAHALGQLAHLGEKGGARREGREGRVTE